MGPVGYDLRYFRGTKELLHTTYDVLTGKSWFALQMHIHTWPNSHEGRARERLPIAQRHKYWECSSGQGTGLHHSSGLPHRLGNILLR